MRCWRPGVAWPRKLGHLEDLVPLGALLADLRQFDEADQVYRDALRSYRDVSPFALAWVCFQLGVLWGELVPERQSARATMWYRKAIAYLPAYVKARVHLAEIYLDCGRYDDAEALLIPVISSDDPEVLWRLGDVSAASGRDADAVDTDRVGAASASRACWTSTCSPSRTTAPRSMPEAATIPKEAFELASVNAANRPTPRAIELARATAIGIAIRKPIGNLGECDNMIGRRTLIRDRGTCRRLSCVCSPHRAAIDSAAPFGSVPGCAGHRHGVRHLQDRRLGEVARWCDR